MKNISIKPSVFAVTLLGAFALGALVVEQPDHAYSRGHTDGHFEAQRDITQNLAKFVTEGFTARAANGQEVRYRLQVVAAQPANSGAH
jgi:hypothetical protein